MKFDYRPVSNTRLYLLSILTGIFAGIFVSLFRWMLLQSDSMRAFMFDTTKSPLFHILVILSMWILIMLVNWLKNHVPYISGSGLPQTIGAIYGLLKYRIPILQFVSKFVGSVFTIGMGLSLGREGPSVQLGALGSAIIGKYTKSDSTQQRYLTLAGAGAGLSAAFTAPIAATVFVIEDMLGWVSLKVTLPVLIASLISGYLAKIILPANFFATLSPVFPDVNFFVFFLIILGLAILATLGGKLLYVLIFYFQKQYAKRIIPVWLKLFCIVILTYIVGTFIFDITAGGEDALIKHLLDNRGNVWWLFALVLIKILFTAISYSTGLFGSIILPLVVMGGLLGKAYSLMLIYFGVITPMSSSLLTLIGMSIFFVSVVRAPISGMMLILEMTTQYSIFFPMVFAVTLTFLFGQYLNLKPIYHTMYLNMILQMKNKYSEIEFQINNESVLDGVRLDKFIMPEDCSLIEVKRGGVVEKLSADLILLQKDIIKIKVPTEKYSELFYLFRTITNE